MCQIDEMYRDIFVNDLLKNRTLYIDGEVTHDTAKRIGASILWLNAIDNSKDITLYLNSTGGSVTASLDFYDIVRYSKASITGIVYRLANSMAAIILQACQNRKALKHSQIVIHNIKVNKEWHEFEANLEKASLTSSTEL